MVVRATHIWFEIDRMTPMRDDATIPGGSTVPVLWVFLDFDSRWRVRKEGEHLDRAYPSRQSAVDAARTFVSLIGSYRLYFQLEDGRFVLEMLNTRPRV
jgi:hypothetical protein